MNLKEELLKNKTVMILLPEKKPNKSIAEIKQLSKKRVCYVTFNKTHEALKEEFISKNVEIENIIFIDAISTKLKSVPDQTDGCYFMGSPTSLKDISVMVSRCIRHKFDYIIIDSLTDILAYKNKDSIKKFFSEIVNNVKRSTAKVIFYTTATKKIQNLNQELEKLVDKVISL